MKDLINNIISKKKDSKKWDWAKWDVDDRSNTPFYGLHRYIPMIDIELYDEEYAMWNNKTMREMNENEKFAIEHKPYVKIQLEEADRLFYGEYALDILSEIDAIIEYTGNVNKRDYYKMTLLQTCAKQCTDSKTIEYLIAKGADVNAITPDIEATALDIAYKRKAAAFCDVLVKHGAQSLHFEMNKIIGFIKENEIKIK